MKPLPLPRKLNLREKVLAVLTVLVIAAVPAYQQMIKPMADRWRSVRDEAHLRSLQYARLERNLAVREQVQEQIEMLGWAAWQLESDEVTLSAFLSELEVLARRPTLRIVSMNPGPVRDEGQQKIYPVRLTVSGRPMEVVQFIAGLTAGDSITGTRSFSIRGLQGGELIECTLNLWMVRLKDRTGQQQFPPDRLAHDRRYVWSHDG